MTTQTPGQQAAEQTLRKIAEAFQAVDTQLKTDAEVALRNFGQTLSRSPLAAMLRQAEAASPAPRRRWWHRLLWWRSR